MRILIWVPRIKPSRRIRKARNGFSLIELVVVIAVLAALTAIALPNFLRVADDAKITVAKQVLVNISKECLAFRLKGKGMGTINDVKEASGRLNSYGNTFGISFGAEGFTFDTSINSNTPLRGNHSCEILAAKSNTFGDSNPVGQFPHFQIDIRSGVFKRDCRIDDSSQTFGFGHCDPGKPSGEQW